MRTRLDIATTIAAAIAPTIIEQYCRKEGVDALSMTTTIAVAIADLANETASSLVTDEDYPPSVEEILQTVPIPRHGIRQFSDNHFRFTTYSGMVVDFWSTTERFREMRADGSGAAAGKGAQELIDLIKRRESLPAAPAPIAPTDFYDPFKED